MNTEKRNYAWLWPYIGKALWLFQMFCIGIAMGLIAIWLRVNTPLGRWNIVLSLEITAVSYVVFTWMLSWLSFGWKILLGKLAGFRFVKMWFRWLYVERKKGKLRIRKAKNYNKQGICHMLPPEKEGERYSMLLYYCGGSIGCGIMALGGFTVFFFSDEKVSIWMALLLMFSVLALMIPIGFILEKVTKDWNVFLLSFQPWMKKAFRMEMQISYSQSMDIWLQDMPEDWFAWDPEYVIVNYDTEWLACFRFQYLFYSERYCEAEQFAEEILEPEMMITRVKKCVACRMLYIKMLLYDDVEQARKYYEKTKDILSKTTESEAYRSLYLYLKYIAKLPETAEEYRVLWEKALAGEKERDVAMEREHVRRIDEKWGGML